MSLARTLELALATEIAAIVGLDVTLAANVYTGAEDETREKPCCVVHCTGGDQLETGVNGYMLTVDISIHTQADGATALTDHKTNAKAIFNHLNDDAIGAAISAHETDFFAYDPIQITAPELRIEERTWIDAFTISVFCAAADITA